MYREKKERTAEAKVGLQVISISDCRTHCQMDVFLIPSTFIM